jgi:hypothetical protein
MLVKACVTYFTWQVYRGGNSSNQSDSLSYLSQSVPHLWVNRCFDSVILQLSKPHFVEAGNLVSTTWMG